MKVKLVTVRKVLTTVDTYLFDVNVPDSKIREYILSKNESEDTPLINIYTETVLTEDDM